MAGRRNFLLGYGERLVRDIPPPTVVPEKVHPYELAEAKRVLIPQAQAVAESLGELPELACPEDRAVALFTLHPTYLAKSYYPSRLLRYLGLEAVGSRGREIEPRKRTGATGPGLQPTAELFVSADRAQFRNLSDLIDQIREDSTVANELIRIEEIRTPSLSERVRPLVSDQDNVLLEVVLHARPEDDDYVVDGFRAFAEAAGLDPQLGRRIYAGGLCFLPLRTHRQRLEEIAEFSFLRIVREMPRLRQLYPPAIASGPEVSVEIEDGAATILPEIAAADSAVRVAICDGGLPAGSPLRRWVRPRALPGTGDMVPEFARHGSAVASALLFGTLEPGAPAAPPFCNVDLWQVLDIHTSMDAQDQLLTVLARIRDILLSNRYEYVNISIGPDLPIEDGEVHAWTAVLDEVIGDVGILATIAVGNGGEGDRTCGNDRVQPPGDCVNGVTVAATNSRGPLWRCAPYSSRGPGRRPGVIKPDLSTFGGCREEPFYVITADDARVPAVLEPQMGTSLAAPAALRLGIGVRTAFGDVLSPLAIKALMVHGCDDGNEEREACGWGQLPEDIDALVRTADDSARIVYQGVLGPSSWVRMPIPMPADGLTGRVGIRATFCYLTHTDPEDPVAYTRSGLEVTFRPHSGKFATPKSRDPESKSFFSLKQYFANEWQRRRDSHKWETTLHHEQRFNAATLLEPVFDVHYNARVHGAHSPGQSRPIAYALVVTVHAPRDPRFYNRVVQRYRTRLEPLQPILGIPLRTRG
jgi:hypothetical protein